MPMNEMPTLNPEYDSERGLYRVTFDPAEDNPSTVAVLAVAAVTEREPVTLEPLNDTVDPECLDELFAPKQDDTPRTGGEATFPFADHDVTVHSDGTIVLDPHQP